ncbi:MFS transporter [Rhizohabitans arisaemae]|uniref:MFS transporter n=1 Tax=Rhizohabitans arisaemae TaxID=2720610 RepID=UPI0024B0A39E|nr:MFS transporter [Rhizohabitans arisaemae]
MSHPTPAADPHTAPAPPDPRRWTALVLLCVAQFMLILDVTVINVALPGIGAQLDLDRETMTWAVTGYTLCFGGLMLLGGRLTDAFGPRPVLVAGLAVFTLASLVTGWADTAAVLIGGRLAQGVGAALLSPAALATITRRFHGAERNKALGVWAALGGVGFAAGALLGGVLTAGPGWRWAFLVNIPVGLVVLAWLPRLIPTATAHGSRRIDLPGAVLVTGATGALIYGVVKVGDAGWGSAAVLVPLAGAIVLYAAFVLVERVVRVPLTDVRVLIRRPVATGAFLMLIGTGLLLGFVFLGSLHLQHLKGLSAMVTGVLFLPVALATAVGGHLAGRLIGRIGARSTAVAGLLVAAIGAVLLILLEDTAGIVVGLVVGASGVVPVFVAATTTALGFVPHHEAGIASGIVNTFHEVGGALGVAVVSTVAAAGIQYRSVPAFTDAYTVAAIAATVAAVVATVLVPRGKATLPQGSHVH